MIEETKEGHKFLVGTDGAKRFMLNSDRLEECIRYIKSNRITHVGINSFIGFRSTDLDFLSELAEGIESISIPEARYDLTIVNTLHNLKTLGFADDGVSVIDLANFPMLKVLLCEHSPRVCSLESCKHLNSLTLSGFKPKDKTLRELPTLPSLKELSLFVTNLESVAGIGRFSSLEELTLFRAPKLTDISGLLEIRTTLVRIEFDVCKRIQNYESLVSLSNLQRLLIGNCAPIESMSFVKTLHKLKFLSFVGTRVVDGDLSPAIGVEYVGFENKRHYSHTFAEIAATSLKSQHDP